MNRISPKWMVKVGPVATFSCPITTTKISKMGRYSPCQPSAIIKHAMALASEAELAALFYNCHQGGNSTLSHIAPDGAQGASNRKRQSQQTTWPHMASSKESWPPKLPSQWTCVSNGQNVEGHSNSSIYCGDKAPRIGQIIQPITTPQAITWRWERIMWWICPQNNRSLHLRTGVTRWDSELSNHVTFLFFKEILFFAYIY